MAHKWLPVFGQSIDFVLKQQEYAHPTEKVQRDQFSFSSKIVSSPLLPSLTPPLRVDPVLYLAGPSHGSSERPH